MLRGWNVWLGADGVLQKAREQTGWDSGAAFEVVDPTCWRVDVRLQVDPDFSNACLVLGIATAKGIMDVPSKPRKYPDNFAPMHHDGCFKWFSCTLTSKHWLICDEDFVRSTMGDNLRDIGANPESRFSLENSNGRVAFYSGDRQVAQHELPPRNYYPVVLICHREVKALVQIVRKRKCGSRDLTTKMFEDRLFTDSRIACGSREFPAHRAVLAAASPVFERMWSTQMIEAAKAVAEINDSPPEVVEAMLKHIYTEDVPEHIDPASLYELAQKYELKDLIIDMGHRVLSRIDGDNMREWARIVHRHAKAGNGEAQKLWDAIYDKLAKNPVQLRQLVESIL